MSVPIPRKANFPICEGGNGSTVKDRENHFSGKMQNTNATNVNFQKKKNFFGLENVIKSFGNSHKLAKLLAQISVRIALHTISETRHHRNANLPGFAGAQSPVNHVSC